METTDSQKKLEELSKDILSYSSFNKPAPAFLTEAAQSLGRVLKEKIQNILPLYQNLALDLLKAQQYEDALGIVETALNALKHDVTPLTHNADFLLLKGEILRQLGRNNEALSCFEQVIELKPNNIGALLNQGIIFLESKDYDKAYDFFKQAEQNKPQDTPTLAILAEGLSRIGSQYCRSRNYTEALEVLNKALELNPNAALALGWKGMALRNLGCNEEAIKSLQQAITLDPSLAWAYAELGKTWSEMGEYEKAVQNLQEAVKREPTLYGVYKDLGDNLCQLERYQEALDVLDEALKFEPQNATIMENRAIALAELDRYPEALQVLDRALKLPKPDYTFLLGLQAEILVDIAEYEQAVKVLDKAIQRDSQYEQIFYLQGLALSKLGRIKEAQQAYTSALQINSSNLWVHKGIAETYYLLGNRKKAEDEYQKIIEEAKQRTDEFYFDLVGWCEYRQDNYSEAARFFVQALSLLETEDPIQLSLQFDLSLALMCSKRYELALQEYKKGIDRIQEKYVEKEYAPKICGLLSVAVIDLKDAMKHSPELEEVKEAKEVLDLLGKALAEADKSKKEILAKLKLDCLADCE